MDAEYLKSQLRIAVLMGGPSEEHEISVKSGRGVTEALLRGGWAVEPVVIPKVGSVEEACEATRHVLQRLNPDVAFIALHGAFGEDGTIQQVCEDLHVAYTGSDVAASRVGMDKAASRRRFEEAGIPVPRWRLVDLTEASALREAVESVAYPLVVKPRSQGSSIGISVVHRPQELDRAIELAKPFGSSLLLEAFVAGRELTVGILGDEALPVVEIRPAQPFFDYHAKYVAGTTQYLAPAPLEAAIAKAAQAVARAAHRALGCRHLSRADLILNRSDIPVLLEVNTIPGFTQTSLLPKAAACVGTSYDTLCEQLVVMAWQSAPRTVQSPS